MYKDSLLYRLCPESLRYIFDKMDSKIPLNQFETLVLLLTTTSTIFAISKYAKEINIKKGERKNERQQIHKVH